MGFFLGKFLILGVRMIKESLILPSQGFPYKGRLEGSSVTVSPITTRIYKDYVWKNDEEGLLHLVDSCLVDCPLKAEDLCYSDLLAVYIKIRSISLGNVAPINTVCPKCGVRQNSELLLDTLECKYLSLSEYPIPLELPTSKLKIKVTIPTSHSSRMAREEAKKRASLFNKPIEEYESLYSILVDIHVESVVGDLVSKAEWYDSLALKDAMFIDQVYKMVQEFGITMTQPLECKSCKNKYRSPLKIDQSFFRTDIGDIPGFTVTEGTLEKGPVGTGKNE